MGIFCLTLGYWQIIFAGIGIGFVETVNCVSLEKGMLGCFGSLGILLLLLLLYIESNHVLNNKLCT